MAKDAKVNLQTSSIASATTTNGSWFDCRTVAGAVPRALKVAMLWTAKGGTTPALALSIQCSDDGSTVRETFTRATVTDTLGEYFLRFATEYRYVRSSIVSTGTSPTATVRVDIVQS